MSFFLNSYQFSSGGVTIPYANIVSHYRFDSNSNDFVSSINGVDTDITYASGKVSNGASFNGSTSKIVTTGSSSQSIFTNGTNDIAGSISMWIKFDSTSGTQYIFNKRDPTTSTIAREYWILYTSGQIRFVLFDQINGGNIRVGYAWTPTTGVWYHLTATYDGSASTSGMKLYVDAVNVGTGVATGTYVKQDITVQADPTIGMLATGGSTFAGDLDELTLWDKELDSTEIGLIKAEGDSAIQLS